jgi:hypothetical protein
MTNKHETVDFVREQMDKALNGFVFENNPEKDIAAIKDSIKGALKDKVTFEGLQFEHRDNNVYPTNLYTALIVKGIVVPYGEVKDKLEYKVPDDFPYFGGSTIKMIEELGVNSFVIIPVKTK